MANILGVFWKFDVTFPVRSSIYQWHLRLRKARCQWEILQWSYLTLFWAVKSPVQGPSRHVRMEVLFAGKAIWRLDRETPGVYQLGCPHSYFSSCIYVWHHLAHLILFWWSFEQHWHFVQRGHLQRPGSTWCRALLYFVWARLFHFLVHSHTNR